MKPLRPNLSPPGSDVIGPSSPVVRALMILRGFFSNDPSPDTVGDDAKTCGSLLANHLIRLLEGCGNLNTCGFHSAAVVLFRSLEDALDCFAAITMVPGAASEWRSGTLKPSDAAKKWVHLMEAVTPNGVSLPEYRKRLRAAFAKYSHCSHDLCLWDLYFQPNERDPNSSSVRGTIKVNFDYQVIDRNAHSIDAHLTGHLLEFIQVVRRAYTRALATELAQLQLLAGLEDEIVDLMERHTKHRCQEVGLPPELRRLKV